jgi:hypothetical protein
VSWGAVLLSYLGIVGAVAYGATVGAYTDAQLEREARIRASVLATEATTREREICGVIINVNKNAKFRADTEQRRVIQTVDYLTDPDVPRDALYRRISENLPTVRADRDVANAAVVATVPPPICQKYVKKEP